MSKYGFEYDSHDLRQYLFMEKSIHSYRNRTADEYSFAQDIRFLCEELMEVPADMKEVIDQLADNVEQVVAYLEDRKERYNEELKFTEEDKSEIARLNNVLEVMLRSRIIYERDRLIGDYDLELLEKYPELFNDS